MGQLPKLAVKNNPKYFGIYQMGNPNFEKQSLLFVTMAVLFSSGLYGIYWLMKNGNLATGIAGKKFTKAKILMMLVVVLFILISISIAYVSTTKDSQVAIDVTDMLFNGVILSVLSIYFVAAMTSVYIARAIGRNQSENAKCSTVKAFVLTFLGFISVPYLQYHINNLGNQNQVSKDALK